MDDDPANMPTKSSRRRFNVDVLISHPVMTPDEITSRLGFEPHSFHCAGEQITTPQGKPVGSGVYHDTRWRHCFYLESHDQWFLFGIDEMIEILVPHASFFADLRETGGSASVNISFLGDGYHGDNVPWQMLAKLAELKIDLGVQCFDVPQNE